MPIQVKKSGLPASLAPAGTSAVQIGSVRPVNILSLAEGLPPQRNQASTRQPIPNPKPEGWRPINPPMSPRSSLPQTATEANGLTDDLTVFPQRFSEDPAPPALKAKFAETPKPEAIPVKAGKAAEVQKRFDDAKPERTTPVRYSHTAPEAETTITGFEALNTEKSLPDDESKPASTKRVLTRSSTLGSLLLKSSSQNELKPDTQSKTAQTNKPLSDAARAALVAPAPAAVVTAVASPIPEASKSLEEKKSSPQSGSLQFSLE